jgi:PAS domain S-box-containing protein
MQDEKKTKAQLLAELDEERRRRLNLENVQREREKRFRRLVENAPDLVFRLNLLPSPHFDYLSPTVEQMTGYPPETFYADPAFALSLVHPEDRYRFEDHGAEFSPTDELIVYRLISRSGKEVWLEQRHVLVQDDEGRPVAVEGIARDRTEPLLSRAALLQSLNEKELLLKEIHHRVKNNLTLVGSLLELQAVTSDDERLREMLSISQRRILSVAHIHEALCQSEDVGRVDLNLYLTRLGNELAEAYGSGTRSIQYDLEAIKVALRNAVQFGLILNELISNAFKHAFPPEFEAEPSIEIRLRSVAAGIETKVTDNGIGMPIAFSLQDAQSLGLQIVRSLTKQLGGEVEFTSSPGIGTSFTVIVPSNDFDLADMPVQMPNLAIELKDHSR